MPRRARLVATAVPQPWVAVLGFMTGDKAAAATYVVGALPHRLPRVEAPEAEAGDLLG